MTGFIEIARQSQYQQSQEVPFLKFEMVTWLQLRQTQWYLQNSSILLPNYNITVQVILAPEELSELSVN